MSSLVENPELLARFRAGDREALRQVYLDHVEVVEVVARRGFSVGEHRVPGARQEADVKDLIQECFVRAFAPRARQSYDGRRPYRPYLLRILRNLMIDRARRAGVAREELEERPVRLDEIDAQLPWRQGVPPPDDAAHWAQMREAYRRFHATLEEEQRQLVVLRHLELVCTRDGERAPCAPCARLSLRAKSSSVTHLAAFGRHEGGRIVWYLPGVAQGRSAPLLEGGAAQVLGSVWLGPEHEPGRYTVYGIFSEEPLTRADPRALRGAGALRTGPRRGDASDEGRAMRWVVGALVVVGLSAAGVAPAGAATTRYVLAIGSNEVPGEASLHLSGRERLTRQVLAARLIERTRARRIHLLLDACHAGDVAGTRGFFGEEVEARPAGPPVPEAVATLRERFAHLGILLSTSEGAAPRVVPGAGRPLLARGALGAAWGRRHQPRRGHRV